MFSDGCLGPTPRIEFSDPQNFSEFLVHKAIGVHPMVISFQALLKKKQEPCPIGGVEKNILSIVAAKHNVVNSAGKMDAGFASHEERLE